MAGDKRTGYRGNTIWHHPWAVPMIGAVVLTVLVGLLILGLILLDLRDPLNTFAGPLIGMLATVGGAFLAFWFANRQVERQAKIARKQERKRINRERAAGKQDLAFEMHREFSSEIMLRARADADKLLRFTHPQTFQQLYDNQLERKARCLFLLSDFYERLAIAIHYERVDLKLLPALFGPIFVWWYLHELHFKLCIAHPDWESGQFITKLFKWFATHSDAEDFGRWEAQVIGAGIKNRHGEDVPISDRGIEIVGDIFIRRTFDI